MRAAHQYRPWQPDRSNEIIKINLVVRKTVVREIHLESGLIPLKGDVILPPPQVMVEGGFELQKDIF